MGLHSHTAPRFIKQRRLSSNKAGETKISSSGSVNVVGQFSFREFKLSGSELGKIRISSTGGGETFLFIFCYGDDLTLFFSKNITKKLMSHQSALYHDQYGCGFYIEGRAKNDTALWVIEMTYNKSRGDGSYQFFLDFKTNFHKYIPEESSIFIGRPIPDALSKLEGLAVDKKNDLSEILKMKATILELYGRKIEQLQHSSRKADNGTLTEYELAQINIISSKITENPGYGYTVPFLCQRTGLSAGKLQEGFKTLYSSTVMEYVRDVRLEKAMDLMQNTDLNISEIVYSIGFTSRSYFSKIFKRKYKCSPSYFMEILKCKSEMV